MIKLFLDDERVPEQCFFYMKPRIGELAKLYREEWTIVRNYNEFIDFLDKNKDQISHISFDHDLADNHYNPAMYDSIEAYNEAIKDCTEKTGYDCALYVKELYKDSKYPQLFVHSMNPAGVQKIINLWKP